MADDGEFGEDVEGVKLALDTMMNVLRNTDAPIPELNIAAFLQKSVIALPTVKQLAWPFDPVTSPGCAKTRAQRQSNA